MDNALWGVALGAGITGVFQIGSAVIAYFKEGRDREHKRQLEKDAWHRTAEKEELVILREAYERSIYYLACLEAFEGKDQSDIDPTHRDKLIKAALRWLAKVVVRHPNGNLKDSIAHLVNNPVFLAENIRKSVVLQLEAEKALYLTTAPDIKVPGTEVPPGFYKLSVPYDDKFRREQFVSGAILNERAEFTIRPSVLTDSQRRLLLDSVSMRGGIPSGQLSLPMPLLINGQIWKGEHAIWKATVILDQSNPQAFLRQWEEDYKAKLNELEQAQQKSS